MSIKLSHTESVQNFFKEVSGLTNDQGSPRMKALINRILQDSIRIIEDMEVTTEEFWTVVDYLNRMGARSEAGLLVAGLGLEHYLDLLLDAKDEAAGLTGGTPRTIEGPLYVAGAPMTEGEARMDDGTDPGTPMYLHGRVVDSHGKPVAGAIVDVWHANTKGFYSHFDPTGEQQPFNMRRTIVTDAQGRYQFQSIVPVGYGCPPDGPTQALLNQLGRHGNRPAHIHFFVTAEGHRKLTTQINIDGDPLVNDDFAYATREGLVPALVERTDAASIQANGLNGPFAEIVFDFKLSSLVNGVDNQLVDRPRLAA